MAIIADAFEYGFFKQIGDFAKNVGKATMDDGLNAGVKAARSAFGDSSVNASRRVVRNAMAQSDDILNSSTRKLLNENAEVISKGMTRASGVEFTQKQAREFADNANFEMLQGVYSDMNRYMAKNQSLTTRGKLGLGAAAYIGTTKTITDDHNAPLIPFL